MTFRYQLTASDFFDAFKAHYTYQAWKRWGRRIFFALCLLTISIVLFCLIWGFVSNNEHIANAAANLLPLAGIAAAWLALFAWLPRYNARRQFKSNPSAQDPIEFSADDSGVAIKSPKLEGKRAWSTYVKWIETPSIFSLYSSKTMFQPIPKRELTPEQVEEFRALLKRHIAAR
jgi:uncharacterized membrane protein YbhN (UPF0104 family)